MGKHVVLGAGPVARAVVASLVSRGIDAAVVSRSGTEVPGATAVKCDALDTAALTRVVSGADAVYQASQPEYHRWVKEFPALQGSVVSALRGSSTVLVAVENLYGYGPVHGALKEDLPLSATTRKGKVRAAMWRQLQAEHASGNIRATAGRASDFFGPHAAGSFVGDRFFLPLLKGRKAEMLGDLDARHSYTYVADFGEALVRLALDERSLGRAWHVPNAPAVTNREFLELAATAAGSDPKAVIRGKFQMALAGIFIPPAREMIEMMYEFEEDFVVDHGAYSAVFGDHATPLEQSVPATVEWWRTEGARASH